MEVVSDGPSPSAQYALVSYIPDPLGTFLNQLREELVPTCRLLSHVTLLPPRVLECDPAILTWEVERRVADIVPFRLDLGAVEKFDKTDVVYLSILDGRRWIETVHAELHQGPLCGKELFPFHPHVTLAQEIEPKRVVLTLERARSRWDEWPLERHFIVETLTFVRNVDPNTWETLAEFDLRRNAPVPVAR